MAEPLTFKKWYERGSYLVHRGHPIFYHAANSGMPGPALLLIHGFPTSSWDWHHLWPFLRERFSLVIAADMIGFGYSAKPREYDYTILDQADLQEALLRELGVQRYHVFAHDYGVTVTQELLARGLDRSGKKSLEPVLESACLLNAGIFPEMQKPTLLQNLLRSRLGPLISRFLLTENRFRDTFVRVFGPATRPSFDELAQFWQQIAYNGGPGIAYKVVRYLDERFEYRERWVGALQKTEVPLRLINGPLDPVSGAHMAQTYRDEIPNADVLMLEGIGHYPQLEAPQASLSGYFDFLERVAEESKMPDHPLRRVTDQWMSKPAS